MGKLILLAVALSACVTEPGAPTIADTCGPAPEIADQDFGIVANGDGTVRMTEDRYQNVRRYVIDTRAWSACVNDTDAMLK